MNAKEILYLRAKDAYYNQDQPILSDVEFDELEDELKKIGSGVVNIVGYTPNPSGNKIKHLTAMKSLRKINEDQEELTFASISQFINQMDERGIEVSAKADGNACTVIYSNGTFSRALTRGDGTVGLDISDKIRHIVPSKIDFNGLIEIRGEIVISKEIFKEKYINEYANPRNFVSGKLGKELRFETPKQEIESEELLQTLQDFSFVAYDVIFYSNSQELDNLPWYKVLDEIGFTFHKNVQLVNFYTYTKEDVQDSPFVEVIYNHYKKLKNELSYLCDGFVIKMVSEEMRNKLGENDHHPKWAIAVKFPAQQVVTKIRHIEWNVGTTGKLTPKAILEPVELDGSIVSKATLYNYSKVFENRTFPQASVKIVKSGDIIPRIIEVVQQSPSAEFYESEPLMIFSEFGSNFDYENIRIEDKEAFYDGDSRHAEIKKLSKGVKILGIDNIGIATCQELYDAGIKNILDLVDTKNRFNKWSLLSYGVFVDGRKLQIIFESVTKKNVVHDWQLIDALQYNQVGTSMSKQLAYYFNNVPYDFTGLNKSVIETAIQPNSRLQLDFIQLKMMVERNLNWEVISPQGVTKQDENAITFEMTGKPPKIGDLSYKDDYARYAKAHGYVHTALNKNTTLLVTDDVESNSGKMKKAKKYGTKIISYQDFYNELYNLEKQQLSDDDDLI